MAAKSSRDLPVSEATEYELLAALRARARNGPRLTRGQATEARHVLLYISQQSMQLREYVVADKMLWTTAAAELDHLIGNLEQLAAYIKPGSTVLPQVHPNELAGSGAPPTGVIMAEQRAGRKEQ